MEIKRVGSQPSSLGGREYFTGAVRVDPLFASGDPGRASGASVTFEPGARIAWHTNADCVPPGEKHWHGAAPKTAMTHIAIQEALDGKSVEWMEQVSDEQYHA